MRAGVALGSNLGDRLAQLRQALALLRATPFVLPPILTSSIYDTAPVDCADDAPRFLNAVVEVDCAAEPADVLARLREIEAALGRPSAHERNASRTIDLDLLYFGDVVIASESLEIPHPRLRERRFVLEPLAEIRPDLVLPDETRSVRELLRELPERPPLVRLTAQW